MAKTKQQLKRGIAELEIERRSGLMRAVVSIVVIIVLIVGKEFFVLQGQEWASHMVVNAMCYISAIVLAGVCGLGARDWKRADDKIKEQEAILYKKKKKK